MRPHGLGRRQFVQGLAAAGIAGGFVARAGAAPAAETLGGLSVLRGPGLDLTLDTIRVNITGRPHMATVVNQTMPGPLLRLREGDDLTIRVHNRLAETSSIHWHGLKLPNSMDGVPGLTFAGIQPGETFIYRFPLIQAGTYWYHSHSGMQEQTGLQGAMIIDPAGPDPVTYDREYVVQLADWTDDDPMTVIANLKQQGDYYNYHQRTLGTFIRDVGQDGFWATLKNRLMWGEMRMDPTDIADVSGALFTYMVNGLPPAANWTAFFRPGERVRLRFINGASMTDFDVRIPGLMLTIVQADGTDVEPVEVEEFRIAAAETYDVIVTPSDGAYTIFAQSSDRSGYARGTLTSRVGQVAPVPAMDPPPLLSMADMGMAHMEMDHAMSGMDMSGMDHTGHDMGGMRMDNMNMDVAPAPMPTIPTTDASGVDPATLAGQPFVESVVAQPMDRLGEAGVGLDGNGRKNLRYSQLRALAPAAPPLVPTRAIVFHLTGNMERWVWGFDGKKFSDAPAVHVALGETVRFILINDTMMAHPIHLHGFLFTLENGQVGPGGDYQPLKHTINVKPAGKVGFVFKADVPGHWAFHCHLLYHMEMGMFRTVLVA